MEERRASGKGWRVDHDADETSGGLAAACGGAVGEDLPNLAGSGGKWRIGGGSGRKSARAQSTMAAGAAWLRVLLLLGGGREKGRREEGDGRPEGEKGAVR